MFDKILIANRGEIACRVVRTARRMGVRTVAIYSDADAHALHVTSCDEAYRVGGASPRESYLNAEAIIAIAVGSRSQAIHPGYGFLSENAGFASACAASGIVFIGPPAAAIAAMGSKSRAKRIMGAAGVPVVRGYHGDDQSATLLAQQAGEIGYPILIKAVAGGGGKGMRIVERREEFDAALASAKREAKASFDDDRMLLEQYLTAPRHIEMQVFGDTHGNVVHLFERDCSVQRRHQKVLEEAPAPGMTQERRHAMGDATRAAAKAIGYVGAGTVEFIVDQKGAFYFMEMNTRLQVEHPVTEMITGIDLVEWQLRVAAGEALPLQQDEIAMQGHAIEARIYAEDPDRGFLPSVGKLVHLRMPDSMSDVRVDTGVRQGDEITPHYDPMIAKLVARGADRAAALRTLSRALADCEIAGVAANVAFLRRLTGHEAFAQANVDTGFIAHHHAALVPPPSPVSWRTLLAAALGELVAITERAREMSHASNDRCSPWGEIDPWWLNSASYGLKLTFADGETRHEVVLRKHASGWRVRLPSSIYAGVVDTVVQVSGGLLSIVAGGEAFVARVVAVALERHVFCAGEERRLVHIDPLVQAGEGEMEGGHLAAPMSGAVVAVMVTQGQQVRKGAPLMVLEAMKMEHTIAAPADGTVRAINFAVGERVNEGADLVDIEIADSVDNGRERS